MKRGRKKYADKYLLEKLQEASVLLGRDLCRADLKSLHKANRGFPETTVYETHFGSWNKALKLAGLPVCPKGKRRFWRVRRNPNNPNTPLRLRFKVFERDNFTCQYCGRTPQDGAKLVTDHINPVANGGLTVLSNLITSCSECNSGKSDLLLGQEKGAARRSGS